MSMSTNVPSQSKGLGSPNWQAIGSFCAKTQRYLIVALDDGAAIATPTEMTDTPQAMPLFQFTLPSSLGGQTLAIVKSRSQDGDLDPAFLLTQREFEIVQLVAKGWANKQIARLLKISPWTVSTHLRRIFLKLNVDTRAEMVYHCADFL